jgi:ABC-type uncharacterized transport system permease subunit
MNNEIKTPLIRLVKREDASKKMIYLTRIAAFVIALILGGLIFLIIKKNPFTAYATILKGTLGRSSGIRQVIKIATPLLGCALALAPCFKMRFWNVGAEGQITMGAIFATYFALNWYSRMPRVVLLLAMALASMIGGALWAAIPAFFKAKFNTNETLFTLLMNYIAIGIAGYLVGGPWEGKPGSQIIPMFDPKAVLPKLFGVQIGWIIVLLLTVFIFVYMNFTKHGYEIAVLGESENTARYAGMNVVKVIVRTCLLSGAINGLVGFMMASGTHMTLYKDVAGGIGFTAITVCWLSQFNPAAMIAIALLLAILERGSSTLQSSLAIPASVSDIITGIILLSMLTCEFFINYRLIFRKKEEQA